MNENLSNFHKTKVLYIKKEFEKVEGELTFHFDTLSVLNLIIKYSISRFNLKRGFPFYFENQST